jgi:hypothetical protein
LAKVETKVETAGRVIAPPSTAASKPNYLKVRLSYLTPEPKHIRSRMLEQQCRLQPPYLEDVCVLLPRMKVFSILENFIPIFEKLRAAGIVSGQANLQSFKVLEEDSSTLAYIFTKA